MLPKAIENRPWIWIIVGMMALMSFSVAFLVIALRNEPQSVPLDNPAATEWTPKH